MWAEASVLYSVKSLYWKNWPHSSLFVPCQPPIRKHDHFLSARNPAPPTAPFWKYLETPPYAVYECSSTTGVKCNGLSVSLFASLAVTLKRRGASETDNSIELQPTETVPSGWVLPPKQQQQQKQRENTVSLHEKYVWWTCVVDLGDQLGALKMREWKMQER